MKTSEMKDLNHSLMFAARLLAAGMFLGIAGSALADVRYVNLNSPSPTAPYTSWTTAATTIQDAVDAAVAGDQILVTNGVYQTGERGVSGSRNSVAVTNAIIVRSASGSVTATTTGRSGAAGPAPPMPAPPCGCFLPNAWGPMSA